jgi:hypothetical protein
MFPPRLMVGDVSLEEYHNKRMLCAAHFEELWESLWERRRPVRTYRYNTSNKMWKPMKLRGSACGELAPAHVQNVRSNSDPLEVFINKGEVSTALCSEQGRGAPGDLVLRLRIEVANRGCESHARECQARDS